MLPLKPYMCDAHEFADSETGIGGMADVAFLALICSTLACLDWFSCLRHGISKLVAAVLAAALT